MEIHVFTSVGQKVVSKPIVNPFQSHKPNNILINFFLFKLNDSGAKMK